MFVDTYTAIHSLISLAALAAGLIVLLDVLGARLPHTLTLAFLILAFLTSATGFGFPFNGLLPSHIVGAIALLVLAVTVFARYGAHLSGIWRSVYVIGIVASAFLLAFVGVAQAFGKIAALHALAPTQSEPPFAIAQTALLVVFVIIGFLGVRSYHPDAMPPLGPQPKTL